MNDECFLFHKMTSFEFWVSSFEFHSKPKTQNLIIRFQHQITNWPRHRHVQPQRVYPTRHFFVALVLGGKSPVKSQQDKGQNDRRQDDVRGQYQQIDRAHPADRGKFRSADYAIVVHVAIFHLRGRKMVQHIRDQKQSRTSRVRRRLWSRCRN